MVYSDKTASTSNGLPDPNDIVGFNVLYVAAYLDLSLLQRFAHIFIIALLRSTPIHPKIKLPFGRVYPPPTVKQPRKPTAT